MSMTLYDLCGADQNHRFSPFCWRAKMTLAHKGVDFETVGTPFTKIPEIEGGATKTVPFLVDGDKQIGSSVEIALYLEENYPDAPSLFGADKEQGIALANFVEAWSNTVLMPGVAQQVVKNVHDSIAEVDQKYFRESREKRFGTTLEAIHDSREGKREAFIASLQPLRMMLKSQPFVCGDQPGFADYVCFGPLKWMAQAIDEPFISEDDEVKAWFDRIDAKYSGH